MSDIEVESARIYKTSTSFNHVLGNLTAIMEDYIKNTMPVNYFKQSRATTEAAFKDLKNFKKNLIAAEKPYLIIDPKLLMDQESESLPQIHWDKYIPIDHHSNAGVYLMNQEFFLKDQENGVALGYTFNRYKLQFGITMIVQTPMIRLALLNYLRSNFRFRHIMPINRYTETLIPKTYIMYMSEKLGLDITSNDFLSRLNKNSKYSILRLHRPATDTTEFFILTTTEIQLKLPDLPSEDSVRVGRLERSSSVNFVIDVELNVMNNFLLLTTDTVEVADEELATDYMVKLSIQSRTPVLDTIIDNKTLYTKISVEFENPTEEIDLTKFLGGDILNPLRHIRENMFEDDYASVKVYKWNESIDMEDTDIVEVDYINFSMKLKRMEKEIVYTIFIYIDMNYISKIAKYINSATLNITKSTYDNYTDD